MGTKRGVALPTPAPDPFLASGGERCGFWRKFWQGDRQKFCFAARKSAQHIRKVRNKVARWADDRAAQARPSGTRRTTARSVGHIAINGAEIYWPGSSLEIIQSNLSRPQNTDKDRSDRPWVTGPPSRAGRGKPSEVEYSLEAGEQAFVKFAWYSGRNLVGALSKSPHSDQCIAPMRPLAKITQSELAKSKTRIWRRLTEPRPSPILNFPRPRARRWASNPRAVRPILIGILWPGKVAWMISSELPGR